MTATPHDTPRRRAAKPLLDSATTPATASRASCRTGWLTSTRTLHARRAEPRPDNRHVEGGRRGLPRAVPGLRLCREPLRSRGDKPPDRCGACGRSTSCRRRNRVPSSSVARRPGFPAERTCRVFADWLSMIAALVGDSPPSSGRTCSWSGQFISYQMPPLRNRQKQYQTVPHRGRSCGGTRPGGPPSFGYHPPADWPIHAGRGDVSHRRAAGYICAECARGGKHMPSQDQFHTAGGGRTPGPCHR
jgi:hypothetical protein